MPKELMDADELRQWLRHIEYQNRCILWALSKGKSPKPKPPPEGIVH